MYWWGPHWNRSLSGLFYVILRQYCNFIWRSTQLFMSTVQTHAILIFFGGGWVGVWSQLFLAWFSVDKEFLYFIRMRVLSPCVDILPWSWTVGQSSLTCWTFSPNSDAWLPQKHFCHSVTVKAPHSISLCCQITF